MQQSEIEDLLGSPIRTEMCIRDSPSGAEASGRRTPAYARQ